MFILVYYFISTDFVQEAKNSERTARNFRNNKVVRIPGVFWVCGLSREFVVVSAY